MKLTGDVGPGGTSKHILIQKEILSIKEWGSTVLKFWGKGWDENIKNGSSNWECEEAPETHDLQIHISYTAWFIQIDAIGESKMPEASPETNPMHWNLIMGKT